MVCILLPLQMRSVLRHATCKRCGLKIALLTTRLAAFDRKPFIAASYMILNT
jgi:hypothetical protein